MATRRKRYQEIHEYLGAASDRILDGNLDDIIAYLQALKAQHPQHTLLYLDFDAGHNSIDISLHGRRPETDEERDTRLARGRAQRVDAAKRNKQAEEEERQEFFRLHEKFGHLL